MTDQTNDNFDYITDPEMRKEVERLVRDTDLSWTGASRQHEDPRDNPEWYLWVRLDDQYTSVLSARYLQDLIDGKIKPRGSAEQRLFDNRAWVEQWIDCACARVAIHVEPDEPLPELNPTWKLYL